ncbi:MAG: hypothetical protein JXA78_12680 [Anaerolineales bacterium]|nr:hypothetical protein [Anaerolineales bacterium]
MRGRKVLRYFALLSLLAMLGLGCGLVSEFTGMKATAQTVGTAVEGGRELLGTGQALATQVQESGAKQTVQAAATKVGESGVKETVQSAATQIDASGAVETVQAKATEFIISEQDVPADIPVMQGEKSTFVGSPQAISYFVNADFLAVLGFYQQEMPARGWSKIDYGTTITDSTAELFYEKDGRKATVVIALVPVMNQVAVVITIEE